MLSSFSVIEDERNNSKFSRDLVEFLKVISYLFQINEIENMRNDRDPLQQKAKRLGAKNMELVQANRRQEDRITNQQDEILSLVIISLYQGP